MKRDTFCLVCGATSPIEATRCQNCDAPLADKTKRKQVARRRIEFNPLTVLVALAILAVIVAAVVHFTLSRP